MKLQVLIGLTLLAATSTLFAAEKCRGLDVAKLNQAFPEAAPWRLESGGSGACSFATAGKSPSSFGYNQTVGPSAAKAEESVRSMKQTMAEDNHVDAAPDIGKEGFSYSPKADSGSITQTSVFFFGHRKSVEITGYLNMAQAITPTQRAAAAKLLFDATGMADDSKALATVTHCPYLDMAVVKRLLPFDDLKVDVPVTTSCIVYTHGNVLTVGVSQGAHIEEAAENMMKDNGCTVDALPRLGKAGAIAYACSGGNPRAQILFVRGGKMFDFTLVPTQEPTADQRGLLVQLAEYAGGQQK